MKSTLVFLAFAGISLASASACTKPVFRYALERWPAAPYQLTVLHEGKLDDDLDGRVKNLCPEDVFNFNFRHYDVKGELPEGPVRENWEKNPDPRRLPLGLLRMPEGDQVIWEGKLDPAGAGKLKELLFCPATVKVIGAICQGDTAVWMLVPGPDEKENQKMRKLLKKSLAAMEEELKLPHELDPLDSAYDDDLAPGIPMKLKFSIQDVDLDAPEMALLKSCVSAYVPDALKAPGPKAIPVFARGRALDVFSLEDLNENVLGEVCFFLSGPCSCRVKEMNPGFDLLMPFPWDRALWDVELDLPKLLKSLNPSVALPKPETKKEKGK